MSNAPRFSRCCQILIVYTVLVIVWGAWVRISHSGDGCGNHWPTCEGAFFPKTMEKKTWIEYLHRLTSGFYGLFVTFLAVWGFRIFPKGSAQRQISLITFILMLVEAGLGAVLVLKNLVGETATVYRLVIMSLHQINSLLLVGATVTLTILSQAKILFNFSWRDLLLNKWILGAFVLLPTTGAWAALANTLFPSTSLWQGLLEDLSMDLPWIFRLRIVHPILALGVGSFLSAYFYKRSMSLSLFIILAMLFGGLTLLFMSPVWMKLVHLTIAQGLWIGLVHYVMISLLSTRR